MNAKEFFTRWGKGIQQITQMQMTKINLIGIVLIIIGILIGLYSTYLTKTWWLFLVLIGSFAMVIMNLVAILQKYYLLKEIENLKGGQNE